MNTDNQKLLLSVVLVIVGLSIWIVLGFLGSSFIFTIIGMLITMVGVVIIGKVRRRQLGKE